MTTKAKFPSMHRINEVVYLFRYWHREDNGVCWHLQMSETTQEWLFFLAQPVEGQYSKHLTIIMLVIIGPDKQKI